MAKRTVELATDEGQALATFEEDRDDMLEILKRTNTKNPSIEDRKALRKLFDERPDIWKGIGNQSNCLAGRLISHLASTGLVKESIIHYLDKAAEELGYAESSPIERMLIDQINITYLDYYWAQNFHTTQLEKGASLAMGDYLERRVNSAQRRHLRAIESLARVRKMGFSGPMQINIAKNQTNFVQASEKA